MKILMVNDPLSLHEAACIKVIMLSAPRSYINHLTLFRHINSRKKRPTQWQSVQTRGHNSVCVVLCVYRLYGVLRAGGVGCVWSWTKCITTNFPHRHRQCLGLGLCILRSSGTDWTLKPVLEILALCLCSGQPYYDFRLECGLYYYFAL